MRTKLLFGLAVCFMTGLIQAGQPASKHTSVREVIFNGCHFKLIDPYNGTLEATERSTPQLANYTAIINPKAQRPIETWIQFSCQNPATPKTYLDRAGIRMTN